MDWIKLQADFYDHPKVLGLSAQALRALVFSWCYCGRYETDGVIPDVAMRTVGMGKRQAAELEEAGLLHRNGKGWQVHDWADYQDPKDAEERRRRLTANRTRRWRERQARDASP